MAYTIISPNSASLLLSPYNWIIQSGVITTINTGAYLRTILANTSQVSIVFDTSADTSPYSRVAARVDNGPWQYFTLSAGNLIFTIATGMNSARRHSLEMVVLATSLSSNRWVNAYTRVAITGIQLDSGGSIAVPQRKSKNIIVFGDSITEGAVTVTSDNTTTAGSDVMGSYVWALTGLDAEVGIIGFGGSGITVVGNGGVPVLATSYSSIISNIPRSFSPAPDVIVLNEGTNDSLQNADPNGFVSAYTSAVNTMKSSMPNAAIIIMVPFGQYFAAQVQSVASATSSLLVPTSGWWSTADSADGIHPYGAAGISTLGPKLLPYVTSALYAPGMPIVVTPGTGRTVSFS